jgi:alkanesulfonate monooxygenase SsuD/methylene tetrahydromethanopterin reductase-like flavin-dependent oxidoreductase (luciferase family)
MVGVMAAIAETDAEASHLFTSAQQQFVNLRRNIRRAFPRPVDTMEGFWTEIERIGVEHTLRYAIVGSRETASDKLERFIAEVRPDEVIVSMPVHDLDARLRSVELFAGLRQGIKQTA